MSLTMTSSNSNENVKLSKRVATQAFLYIFFFFATWIFPMIQFVVANNTGNLLFPLLVLTTILNPSQGAYDALIYLRPRYLQYRAHVTSSPRQNAAANPSRVESAYRALLTNDDDGNVEGKTMPETIPGSDGTHDAATAGNTHNERPLEPHKVPETNQTTQPTRDESYPEH